MRLSKLTRYRPTRTPDGGGGFTVTYASGVVFWGTVRVHETDTRLICRTGSSVAVEDVIATADDAYYRVVELVGGVGAPYAGARLERIERPVHP